MRSFSIFCIQLLFLQWLISITKGAKILALFAVPAKSHFIYNDAIAKTLAAAGHQITVMSPFPHTNPPENYNVIDLSENSTTCVGRTAISELDGINTYELIQIITSLEEEYCDKIMKLNEVQKLNIPVVGTASQRSWLLADRAINNPNNPSFVPSEFGSFWKTDDFYERLMNVWKTSIVYFSEFYLISSKLQKFYAKYSEELNFYDENSIKPTLIFYNTHSSYDPRPMNPNALEIAGIHIEDQKPLPKNIKSFIEESTNGVILFTLGSLIKGSSLSERAQLAFRDAFAEIPQRVIWKYEEEMKNIPPNVLLSRWLPQRDILAHKNMKAFITHCGQSGTYEAIHAGVPMVTVSMYGDQHSTAAILRNLEVAVSLNIHTLSKEFVLEALHSIINETKYRDNMQRLSKSFKDRPMSPQKTVVYWTEYVIRHNGAPHLQSSASHLYWFQYLLLDVVLFVVFTLSLLIYPLYCMLEMFCFHFTDEE